MSANSNSKTIPYHVRLPNQLFWDFVEAAKVEQEDRATILRRMIREFIKRTRKASVLR